MTDAEFEAQKERLRVLRERWHDALGLKWWDITHEYERDSGRFELDTGAQASRALAVCEGDWRYLKATVTWNMRFLPDTTDDYLERAYVHEMMHIFLLETRLEDAAHHAAEERVAETLARAFIWVRDFSADGKAPAIAKVADGPAATGGY